MKKLFAWVVVVSFCATPQAVLADGTGSNPTELQPYPISVAGVGHAGHVSAHDLRAMAAIQVLQPTATPTDWELLGSAIGGEWTFLATFHLADEDVAVLDRLAGKTGSSVPTRFVIGELRFDSGEAVPFVVASVANVGQPPPFPPGALVFLVLDVTTSLGAARSQARSLAHEASEVAGLEVGEQPVLEPNGSQPGSIAQPLISCETACRQALDAKAAVCESTYVTCASAATAALGLCFLGCPATGPGCALCAAAYALALYVCDSNLMDCRATAQIDYQTCIANCPDGPEVPCYENCTPVVLNLDGREGFRFTSGSGGVFFDLDGNGVPNHTAWTQPDGRLAFLVLDRNANGTIDDGRELFGAVTPQPSSEDPNGFRALATFDAPLVGGNGDGVLSGEDAVFSLLGLWIDDNHDGVSQAAELVGLEEAGVTSIGLDYVVSNRTDPHGNLIRYKTLVRMRDRVVEGVDVVFVQAD